MKENFLEKRFDPDRFQTDIKGKIIRLSDLSHEDLLQVACEGMQAMEYINNLQRDMSGVIKAWRKGDTAPAEDWPTAPSDTPSA